MLNRRPILIPVTGLATALLLLAAVLRLAQLGTLPPGYSPPELDSLDIMEQTRSGSVMVFHQPSGQPDEPGQETLFHIIEATAASLTGIGLITMRLPGVGISLLTLVLTYYFTARLFGRRTALLALALMAVGFWPVLFARLAVHEVLAPFFTISTLLAFAHAFHIRQEVSPDPPATASYAILGVVAATSLYAHWTGLLGVVLLTLLLAYMLTTRQRISRYALGFSGFAVLVSIIVAVPYVVTTARTPELSGLAAMRQAMTPDNLPAAVVDGLAALFFRGDANPVFNLPGRPLLDPVSGILLLIGLGMALRSWRQARYMMVAAALLIGLIPALLHGSDGVFLALSGALPLIYITLALGANVVIQQVAARMPPWRQAVPAVLTALVTLNLLWTGHDLFGVWQYNAAVRGAYQADRGLLANYLDRNDTRLPITVCSPQLQTTDDRRGDIDLLRWMMQREHPPLRYVDCSNALILSQGGAIQQIVFTQPEQYEAMQSHLRSWVDPEPGVPVANLVPRSVIQLEVEEKLQDTVGRLLTTAPTHWAPEAPGGPGPADLPVRFGGNLSFMGYVLDEALLYHPGDIVTVISYWRVDGAVPPNLRIFTHILSDPVVIVAQNLALNVWPQSLQNRDLFIQVNYIVLPDSTPPGQYDISIGAYLTGSQTRLPVFEGERVRGDRLFLYSITVEDPADPNAAPDLGSAAGAG